jgi:UDP-N-acetylglucosamine 2-epimerase (non-hydrolysing)
MGEDRGGGDDNRPPSLPRHRQPTSGEGISWKINMKHKKKILIAFGTRPEALKFVPLIKELERAREFDVSICLTGQHREMVNQVIKLYNINVHNNLRTMRANQSLEYISGQVISKFGDIIKKTKPDLVFVQGDTATALMVGIASFYAKIPIAHLEAGLRSWNKFHPFPEEMNRTLLSRLADYHFTPTRKATQNLISEGISRKSIFETGNTIVDTVRITAPLIKNKYSVFKGINFKKRILFVTAHRRESFGKGLKEIFVAFKQLAARFDDIEIVYPVHLNPNVQHPAKQILKNVKGVHLIRPLTYEETYWMMKHCYAILTDSGGIQEEAPSFKKPVLVLRNVTERWEGIEAGVSKLVGTKSKRIVDETEKLLINIKTYKSMIARRNPYGDGFSAQKIVKNLKHILK